MLDSITERKVGQFYHCRYSKKGWAILPLQVLQERLGSIVGTVVKVEQFYTHYCRCWKKGSAVLLLKVLGEWFGSFTIAGTGRKGWAVLLLQVLEERLSTVTIGGRGGRGGYWNNSQALSITIKGIREIF